MNDFERLVEELGNDIADRSAAHGGAKSLCCLAEAAIRTRVVSVGERRSEDAAGDEGVVGCSVAIVRAGDESAGGGLCNAFGHIVAFAHLVVARILMKEGSEDDVAEDVLARVA